MKTTTISIASSVLFGAAACSLLDTRTSCGVSAFTPSVGMSRSFQTRIYSELPRDASQMGFVHEDSSHYGGKKRSSLLSAVAIDTPAAPWEDSAETESLLQNIQPILSSALLITGSTVGASCLVLPEMAAKPGMAVSTALFFGAYIVNLISGLIIAEVAIKQHDSSGQDPPSSFKEFADANLDLPMAGTVISCISIFVNTCIMSFDLTRAGQILSNLSGGLDPFLLSVGAGSVVAALGMTQNAKKLSGIASVAVTALFLSFAGLLLPGLANVQDPLAVFTTPGTCPDIWEGISQAAPIILMTCVYQNIVPSVTKILDYDRKKVVTAMILGSALPLCMFLAWCFASIGGGIGAESELLLTIFSLAAVSGSSIGTIMSVAGELDSFLSFESLTTDESSPSSQVNTQNDEKNEEQHRFSMPAVLMTVTAPLVASYLFAGGQDFTAALSVSGAYGTPLLYGVLPVAMAWTQRQKLREKADLVPGGSATLTSLGAGAMAFMGQELFQDFVQPMLGGVTI